MYFEGRAKARTWLTTLARRESCSTCRGPRAGRALSPVCRPLGERGWHSTTSSKGPRRSQRHNPQTTSAPGVPSSTQLPPSEAMPPLTKSRHMSTNVEECFTFAEIPQSQGQFLAAHKDRHPKMQRFGSRQAHHLTKHHVALLVSGRVNGLVLECVGDFLNQR